MANIQPVIHCELNPFDHPVSEICAVIMAIVPYHPGQEDAILQGVKEVIEQRQTTLKGVELNEQVRGNNRKQENK